MSTTIERTPRVSYPDVESPELLIKEARRRRRIRIARNTAIVAVVVGAFLAYKASQSGPPANRSHSRPGANAPRGAGSGAKRIVFDWKPVEAIPTEVDGTIACPTAEDCMAVVEDGLQNRVVMRSIDGGRTWTRSPADPTIESDAGLACPSANLCFAVNGFGRGQGGVAVTHDLGLTWTTDPVPGVPSLDGISCPTTRECLAFYDQSGLGSTIVRTLDSGRSWQVVSATIETLTDISCGDADHCVVSGDDRNSTIFSMYTTNSGRSWDNSSFPSAFINTSISMSDADAGVYWVDVACPTSLSCEEGIESGPAGSELAAFTNNGGRSWEPDRSLAGIGTLGSLTCPTPSRCWGSSYSPGTGGTPVLVE
ncbi:MAG: hypothetical protein WAM97_06870, partial [Acidimicrobiales bacterium]